ncbi:MAG: hypothetical protein IPM57_12225 [Oligoflexia bacterium]|nr:hypothetical protein [Oligoflexia bacterium]
MNKGKKYLKTISILALLVALVFIYQNCGDVKLKQATKSVDSRSLSVENPKPTYLKPPVPFEGIMRAAFFIDMSHSTVTTTCPDSVDEPNPFPAPGLNCINPDLGSDSKLRRFKIINKWLDQMEAYMTQNNIPADNFKAAVVPFSGGMSSRDLLEYPSYSTRFTNIAGVRTIIANLKKAQEDFGKTSGVATNNLMFTSVPAPKLERLHNFIQDEITALRSAQKLSQSRFEIVFFSDGVPNPRGKHIKEAIRRIWDYKKFRRVKYLDLNNPAGCRLYDYMPTSDGSKIINEAIDYSSTGLDCMNKYEDLVDRMVIGQGPYFPPYSSSCYTWADQLREPTRKCFEGLDEFDYDGTEDYYNYNSFMSKVNALWGSPVDNLVANIMYKIFSIYQLFQINSEAQFRFSFLRLDSDEASYKTPAEELDPEVNWIKKAKEIYKNQHRYVDKISDNPPFALFPGSGPSESYRLGQFYAFNINARVNSNYVLDVDSDGDGLFDIEEAQLGTNSSNPRTNGVCNDKIRFNANGCIQSSCDPQIDKDGDGLNECEEITLGTSDLDFDTDGDGVPDGIEVLYGLSPLQSDYNISSNPENTNLTNLRMGLMPFLRASQVAREFLINLRVDFYNYIQVRNNLGQLVQTPGYIVQLKNIRIVDTQSTSDNLPLYKSRAKLPVDLWQHHLQGGSHLMGENRIVYMGRVDNTQNPGDAYWIIKTNEFNFNSPPGTVNINFDNFNQISVLDPQGEIK